MKKLECVFFFPGFLDDIPLVCRDQPPQDECGQTELYYTFKYNASGHATCLPLEEMCTHISETNTFLQEDWCTGLCIGKERIIVYQMEFDKTVWSC